MGHSSEHGIDVITVPDFSRAGYKFEARTLFFLASWIDCGRKQHPCSLHLACIDEPPKSVCALAENAGATVSVHKPATFGHGGFVNKLRGFDIVPRHSRFLLLDTDIFFWSDPTEVVELGECIAASAASRPRVPGDYWPQIFAEVKVRMPEERISCRWHQTGQDFPREPGMERGDSMTPYFNSGVIYGLWSAGLQEKWLEHSEVIFNAFSTRHGVPASITHSNQVGFATAVQALRSRIPFCFLPDRYNAIRPVLASGAIALSDVVLLHAVRFLSRVETRAGIAKGVRDYEKSITHVLRPHGRREAAKFRQRLRRLYRNYVEPFLTGDAP